VFNIKNLSTLNQCG